MRAEGGQYRPEQQSKNLTPCFALLLLFVVLFIVGEFKMDTWKRDLCEMDRCKSQEFYERELRQIQNQWERLDKKHLEYEELGKEIERCQGEIGRLRSLPLENQQGESTEEIKAVHARIVQCKGAIDDGLKRVKEAVKKTDL